jgi:hypothetical protein
MALYENQNKQEIDPKRILERHLIGLHDIQEDIKDQRLSSQMAQAGMRGHGLNQHASSESRHQFAKAANQYADRLDAHEQSDAKMYASILAVLPNTIDALHKLRGGWKNAPKDYNSTMSMIRFNDTLSEIITSHPTIQPKTLIEIVRAATQSYGYNMSIVSEMEQQTFAALRGIKHERAFEAVLYYLPEGYKVYETTDEEDKHGADFLVQCPNRVLVSVDVKSSPESAERATVNDEVYLERHQNAKRYPHLAIFSGFTDNDFDPQSPWQPGQEAILRELPRIQAALLEKSTDKHSRILERV